MCASEIREIYCESERMRRQYSGSGHTSSSGLRGSRPARTHRERTGAARTERPVPRSPALLNDTDLELLNVTVAAAGATIMVEATQTAEAMTTMMYAEDER